MGKDSKETEKEKKTMKTMSNKRRTGLIILLTALIALLLPLSIVEFSAYAQLHRDPAQYKGTTYVAVADNDMSENGPLGLKEGDAIAVEKIDPIFYRKNDVIAYRDHDNNVQISRIIRVEREKKGSDKKIPANFPEDTKQPVAFLIRDDVDVKKADDCEKVTPEQVIGLYSGKVEGGASKIDFYGGALGFYLLGLLPLLIALCCLYALIRVILRKEDDGEAVGPSADPTEFTIDRSTFEDFTKSILEENKGTIHLVPGRVLKTGDPQDPKEE